MQRMVERLIKSVPLLAKEEGGDVGEGLFSDSMEGYGDLLSSN